MASASDISVSAAINLLFALAFLMAFAFLRLQPIRDRVYFPKWYLKGIRASPRSSRPLVKKFVNLDVRTYFKFWNWMPAALRMPQPELIDHAGLDSAVHIRMYLLGLKIFIPIAILGFAILVPVNWTGKTLEYIEDLTFSDIDKLSISNVSLGSDRFWAHLLMAYLFSFWTCYVLYKEYMIVSAMRLHFLASEERRPDQFTVLVRNVPPDPDASVSQHVEHFFCVNHPDHYLSHQVVYNTNKLAKLVEKKMSYQNWHTYHQTKFEKNPKKRPTIKTGFWGLWGNIVDAIDYYTAEIEKLSEEEAAEREKVMSDPKAIIPAAFVSFKSRWGAAVCAQTRQSRNPTIWLTEWAPEPRDVYWDNLAIPVVGLAIRRLLMGVGLFFLTFFFMIPIAFVQSMANIEGIEKVFPFLKPLIEAVAVKSIIQERRSAAKYHLFLLVNVFFGSIFTGSAFEQLQSFLDQAPSEIPKTVGVAFPMKATFFITYLMVDGWAGIAAEILRLGPLVMFHIKNTVLVKTEQDREQAMDPGSINFATSEPLIQLYFLLGLVYSVIAPILLPFIIIFFAFSYVVFRHQIINVCDQKYESAATFWPDVHRRVVIALIISQLLLMGLLSTKNAAKSTPLLIVLPVLTIWFHLFCKARFESAFVQSPLQDAMVKDTLERATEPNLSLKAYLRDAYIHPVFKCVQLDRPKSVDDEENNPLVATKRNSRMDSKTGSDGLPETSV